MARNEFERFVTDVVNQILTTKGFFGWSFEVFTDRQHRPQGGLAIRFEHPLANPFSYGMSEEQTAQAPARIEKFIDDHPEFRIVAAAENAVTQEHHSLLRRLRTAAKHETVPRAMGAVVWTLHDEGFLTEREARWFEQSLERLAD